MHLYDALSARLSGDSDNKGRIHADCPFCGAEGRTRSHRPAWHFYLYEFERGSGYVCWSCGAKGTLRDLARHLDIEGDETPRPLPERPEPPTPPWDRPDALDKWTAHMMRPDIHAAVVAAWQQYKPLTAETIRRERLAYGRMSFYDEARQVWYAGRHERLLVPLIIGRRIVGIRGRAASPKDTGPKWITASYSEPALMGLEAVTPGSTVVWCENLIDRLLAQQDEPGIVAIASGGLSWQPGWIAALARRQPKRVIVWFDHDLAGNGGGGDRPAMMRQWLAEITARRKAAKTRHDTPMPQAPEGRGPLLVAELRAAGVNAELFDWPRGTPRKADLGWYLENAQ